jgi:hypothetical protein
MFAVVLAFLLSCSSSVEGTGTSSSSGSCSPGSSGRSNTSSGALGGGSCGSSGTTTGAAAIQACEDVVTALYNVAVKCDVALSREEILDSAVGGSCSNVVGIRDESELRNYCLTWLENVDCGTFANGTIHPSCQEQLLTSSS